MRKSQRIQPDRFSIRKSFYGHDTCRMKKYRKKNSNWFTLKTTIQNQERLFLLFKISKIWADFVWKNRGTRILTKIRKHELKQKINRKGPSIYPRKPRKSTYLWQLMKLFTMKRNKGRNSWLKKRRVQYIATENRLWNILLR